MEQVYIFILMKSLSIYKRVNPFPPWNIYVRNNSWGSSKGSEGMNSSCSQLSLVPPTHSRWMTTSCNSCFPGSDTPWSLWVPALLCTYSHSDSDAHKQKQILRRKLLLSYRTGLTKRHGCLCLKVMSCEMTPSC